MRIAIPTNDMTTISSHFGRSKGVLIFEVEKGLITNLEYKVNTFTSHSKNNKKEHEHGKSEHSHTNILNALKNCGVIITGGMGKRLFEDFSATNTKVYLVKEKNIQKIFTKINNGTIESDANYCNH